MNYHRHRLTTRLIKQRTATLNQGTLLDAMALSFLSRAMSGSTSVLDASPPQVTLSYPHVRVRRNQSYRPDSVSMAKDSLSPTPSFFLLFLPLSNPSDPPLVWLKLPILLDYKPSTQPKAKKVSCCLGLKDKRSNPPCPAPAAS